MIAYYYHYYTYLNLGGKVIYNFEARNFFVANNNITFVCSKDQRIETDIVVCAVDPVYTTNSKLMNINNDRINKYNNMFFCGFRYNTKGGIPTAINSALAVAQQIDSKYYI